MHGSQPTYMGAKAFPAQRTWDMANGCKAKTVFPSPRFQPANRFRKCGNGQDTLLSAKVADACVPSPGRSVGREIRCEFCDDRILEDDPSDPHPMEPFTL